MHEQVHIAVSSQNLSFDRYIGNLSYKISPLHRTIRFNKKSSNLVKYMYFFLDFVLTLMAVIDVNKRYP